jgi:hypothetical protein
MIAHPTYYQRGIEDCEIVVRSRRKEGCGRRDLEVRMAFPQFFDDARHDKQMGLELSFGSPNLGRRCQASEGTVIPQPAARLLLFT